MFFRTGGNSLSRHRLYTLHKHFIVRPRVKETAFGRGVHGDARDDDDKKESSLQPLSHLLTSRRNSGQAQSR